MTNADYIDMVRQLLEIEEDNELFFLTSSERREFQQFVMNRMGDDNDGTD